MEVIVSVAPDRPDELGAVVDALVRAGLHDVQVLDAAGVVTGTVEDPMDVEALRAVAGVGAVEESRRIDIPPPDAPVQ